jgi:hypothetical protein
VYYIQKAADRLNTAQFANPTAEQIADALDRLAAAAARLSGSMHEFAGRAQAASDWMGNAQAARNNIAGPVTGTAVQAGDITGGVQL